MDNINNLDLTKAYMKLSKKLNDDIKKNKSKNLDQ